MAPALSPAAEEALAVWLVMGGWHLERLPVVLVLLGVQHVDGLLDRLIAIRKAAEAEESERARDD